MKNSYILLRNNKESSALSIEELQEIGLKKTDLIWVECQSMNWRSPFEITELKNLVSAGNDEDKKNGVEKFISREITNDESHTKKKKAGKTWIDPYVRNLEKYSYPERVIVSELKKKEIDFPSNKSFSDREIKVTLPKSQLQREQQNKRVSIIQLPAQIKKIAFYICLMLTGALLTLLIMNLKSERPDFVQHEKVLPIKSTTPVITLSKVVIDTSTIYAANIIKPNLFTEKNSVTTSGEQKRKVMAINNILPKKVATTETRDSSKDSSKQNTKPVTNLILKPVTIEDISSKIALEANNYNVGTFGGIRNLKITLQNGSKCLLDKVTIELKYLNPDGNVIKTEQLYFQNVQPQNEASLAIDKSKRGVKVEYHVTNIECKELTSSQPPMPDHGNYSTN